MGGRIQTIYLVLASYVKLSLYICNNKIHLTTIYNLICNHLVIVTGIEPSEDPLDVSSMDDDLMSLLNNFPTSMPDPDWYPGGGEDISNMETYASTTTSGDARQDVAVPQDASPTRVGKHDKSLNSCYWNNMPGIC